MFIDLETEDEISFLDESGFSLEAIQRELRSGGCDLSIEDILYVLDLRHSFNNHFLSV